VRAIGASRESGQPSLRRLFGWGLNPRRRDRLLRMRGGRGPHSVRRARR
jgi:hypothetical protein